jgi:hypothetical protein
MYLFLEGTILLSARIRRFFALFENSIDQRGLAKDKINSRYFLSTDF